MSFVTSLNGNTRLSFFHPAHTLGGKSISMTNGLFAVLYALYSQFKLLIFEFLECEQC